MRRLGWALALALLVVFAVLPELWLLAAGDTKGLSDRQRVVLYRAGVDQAVKLIEEQHYDSALSVLRKVREDTQ